MRQAFLTTAAEAAAVAAAAAVRPVGRSLRRAAWPALAVLCAGCAVGPNYVRPSAAVPTRYKELPPAQAESGEWKPAQPRDVAPRGEWWKVFGDAELDALEEQVTAANQTIAQAEAAFRGARALARGARAGFFPTVGAAASATRSSGVATRSSVAAGAAPTVTTYSLPVDFSWEVDLFGGVRRGVEAGVAGAQASAANLEAVRLAMHAELAADYFALHGLDAERQLLDSTVEAYQTALRLTENRFKQGIASGIDVAQAQTQLESVRAQATDLEIGWTQTEHAIAVLVGKPPGDFAIAPHPIGVAPPVVPIGVPSELLERRPDVAAAERLVAAANAQIGVARAAFFPTLTLSGSAGFQSSTLARFFTLPNRFWSLGPALAETLFTGGKRRAAKEQAMAAYDAAVAAYRGSALGAFQEVEDNLAALRLLAVESEQQAAAVGAAQRSLKMAEDQYRAGVANYLQVVSAQTVALANERTAVNLATSRFTATVNLIKALGGGWAESDLPDRQAIVRREPPQAPAGRHDRR